MTRFIAFVALAGIVAFIAGCAMPQNGPVYGGLYTQVKGPQSMGDFNVPQAKTGTAVSQSIIGVAIGDSSIATAMKNAGITKVHHVDTETFGIMGFYATSKTIVYGE